MKASSDQTKPDLAAIVQAAGPHHSRKLRLILTFTVIVIVGGVWFGWSWARANSDHGPAFTTTPLVRGDINLTITATGNLEPTNEITVGSELSGTVLEVYVDTNDRVTKGQPLAKLDTTKLTQEIASSRANLRSAQASVAQARATVKETAATLTRLQELRRLSGGKLPSQTDFDAATAAADRASANLLSAEAAVAQAEANVLINENDLTKAVIKSPIDGIVLTRNIEPGATVAASFTAPELFVIAENLEHMKLIVTVAEADIGRLTVGQQAVFTVDAWPERSYTAKVLKVAYGSAVTNNVVTYETELEVTNTDLSLRPGMTATATIRVAESKHVFLVPAAALRFDPATSMGATPGDATQKKSFIQSLTPMPPRRTDGRPAGEAVKKPAAGLSRIWILRDDRPEPVEVKVGLSDGRNIEVTGAELAENLPVITRVSTPPSQ